MAQYSSQFLDDVRSRVRVSDVVGQHVKLNKKGSEFIGLSPFQAENSASFTVNDKKQFFHDFASGKHGDIFEFLIEQTGCSFPEAVVKVCRDYGITLPSNGSAGPPVSAPSSSAPSSDPPPWDGPLADLGEYVPSTEGRRKIIATYDYTDADGALLYQVCRVEWIEKSRKKKSFLQRRPVDGEPGHWIWGLSGGDYLRSPNGDWYLATDERLEKWPQAETREIEATAHGLYRLPELREEMGQPKEDRRTVMIPEGERKVDVLVEWGMVATCSSGGARHFLPHHAQEFVGADVVIQADHDKAGREGAEKKATMIRKAGAARIRVLDWGNVWLECPAKGDVVDFRDAGHTSAELYEIIDKLPDWSPKPHDSKFNVLRWADQETIHFRNLWLVDDLIPLGGLAMVYGEEGCGKSFAAQHVGMCVSLGWPVFGHKIMEPGGTVYCASEDGGMFHLRMQAYRKHHGLPLTGIDFHTLREPIDLFTAENRTQDLIDEVLALAEEMKHPLRLIVVDTYNAATPGLNENSSEGVSVVLRRLKTVREATGAAVLVVHHKNAQGGVRGHTSFYNAFDARFEVAPIVHQDVEAHDPAGRLLRNIVCRKQRHGPKAREIQFVLRGVEVGRREDGKAITSCVAELPMGQEERRPGSSASNSVAAKPDGLRINDMELMFFKAFLEAYQSHAVGIPEGLKVTADTALVVPWSAVTLAYRNVVPSEYPDTPEGRADYKNFIAARLRRARNFMQKYGIIGVGSIENDDSTTHYLWPMHRRVRNGNFVWPPLAPVAKAPTEIQDDLPDDVESFSGFPDGR